MSTSQPAKRKFEPDGSISPPRSRNKSGVTKADVASFFTPTSQKAPVNLIWQERGATNGTAMTLIVGRYQPSEKTLPKNTGKHNRNKIAAFDFDSTLIETASGKKFTSDASDWKWWHPSVPGTLRKLYFEDGFRVVVLSNQGGISLKADTKGPKPNPSKLASFKTKVAAVFGQLDFPVSIYAATGKDIFRKPRTGMWKELLEDYDLHRQEDLDVRKSIFVGDAGGRDAVSGKVKDFSCSDRNFAENVGITFHTPEEYFLHEPRRPFTRTFDPAEYISESSIDEGIRYTKSDGQDIVLLCGSPGAGKSTFYWRHLSPLGYARINQDNLKSREKCLKVAQEHLKKGESVAIDNTNADIEVRGKWVEVARKYSVPIRCVLFTAEAPLCEHNNAVRALNPAMNPEKRELLPAMAFKGFGSRYQRPSASEGFQDITEVNFKFDGTEVERTVWSQYWS